MQLHPSGFWRIPGWFLPLLLITACSPEPIPPPLVTATSLPAAPRIGLTTGAAGLGDLIAEASSLEPAAGPLVFIQADNETLLADLEESSLDAVLIYEIPDGSQHWFNPVALDGLVLVTHAENMVHTLTREEVQAIFSGQIDNWSRLAGPDLPVTLVTRETGSGTRAIFEQRIMAGLPTSVTAQVVSSNQFLLETVAAVPGAVGYSMMGSSALAPEMVNMVAIDGRIASPAETSSQNYPYSIPLYFVSQQEPSGALRAFLAWLQSLEGQAVIGEKYGRIR